MGDKRDSGCSQHSSIKLDTLKLLQPNAHYDCMDSVSIRGSVSLQDVESDTTRAEKTGNSTDSQSSEEEGEFKSCTNSEVPEETGNSANYSSAASLSEAACSINMSANMANKLNQMRASRESLDNSTEHSCDDIAEELGELPALEPSTPPNASKGPSQNPSLRQVFPYISCLPFENNIVFCFVLSVWDNIVGPQTVNVWKRKSFPSQKTFDDVFEEGGDAVEVGEDLMNLRQDSDLAGGRLDTHHSSPSTDESWPGKQRGDDTAQARRYSSTSNDSDKYSFTEQERKSPGKKIGKVLSSTRKLSSPRLIKDKERKLSSSVEAFCEEFGNNILMQSLGAVKDHQKRTPQENVEQKCESSRDEKTNPEQREEKKVSLANLAQSSFDSVAESEEQEFGSSWVYGRSRLRVGTVVWYVTVHSVGVGQVGPTSQKVTSSLHVVPHQGIIIVAARFTVEEEDGAVPYCLSMVVPLEEYKNFLPLSQTVTTWLVTIAATTRLLLTKHGLKGGRYIKDKLVELCEVLVALRSASLDQYPLTPSGRPPDDRRFTEIILTSHLQTMGSTVVVADSPNAANKVIMWLAQFSDPSTLHASRLCLSYTQWPFHPGLFIQGIVRSANGEVNLSAQKLIQSSRPLTVVDVNRGTVKQTGPPDVHARRNSSALRQELVSLWHGLSDVSVPSESLLESIRTAAPLVKRFLHDYDRLNSCSNEVRQDFIRAFLRSLQYTALALITWTQHEWSAQRRRSGYGSLRRALCSVFDLDEADLRVVLAQAEILEPGFYSYVSSMSQ